ncbi:18578_t:CDS:10 [Racocetra fulgida]|uniref:18578_t:CDS:1 n=1 Tax=Racocetra fulgida TaxID=60492 RepID=A0A9N8VK29_9GLOM|nr:18578_t:CDS:10 [Racocetra fulgida]
MAAYKINLSALIFLIYIFVLENVVLSEYRTLNGTNNDKDNLGVINMPFVRQQVPLDFFQDNAGTMISTPGNYTTLATAASCTDRLPPGILPLPRCVSNILHSYRLQTSDAFNLTHLQKFKSKRSTSHVVRSINLIYNDAKQYFGLNRARDWSDISSDPEVQKRLRDAYGTVDQVEAFSGGLAEDHVPGSNLGPLFYHTAGFTAAEIDTIHNTTLAMVIARNIPSTSSIPSNLWVVQPIVAPNATGPSSYSPFNILKFSNTYQVQWRIDGSDLYLLMTMQSTNAWFGIGFNSLDGGIPTAYQKPPRDTTSTFLTVLSKNSTNGYTQVEVKRPLNAPNRRPITNSAITRSMSVNFFAATTYGSITNQAREMQLIGTDITNDFFFDPNVQTVIAKNFDKEHELLLSNDFNDGPLNYSNIQFKDKKPNSRTPKSVARSIDLLNSVTFKNTRVAMHRHSKFATAKLATMVVARISDYDDENVSRPVVDGILPYSTISTPKISPEIFRRYILTNIEDVTRYDAENPVKKMTFQVIHPYEKLPEILPGDYIEIMSYTNKATVVRPYTLLKGPSDNTFSIIVKIYKDGVMSQHLGKQLKNFEIAVRGPFDISERIEQSISSTTSDTGLRRRLRASLLSTSGRKLSYAKSNAAFSGYGSVSSEDNDQPAPRILLNHAREDKCWDYLFLVCGGTGYVGTIDDNLLYNWISTNYNVQQPPEIPERPNFMQLQSPQPLSTLITNPEELYNDNFNQSDDHIVTMSPTSIDQAESPLSRSPTRSPDFKSSIYTTTNAMVILNERHEYMKLLANDNSRQLRVMVCGPPAMMESVKLSLNKIEMIKRLSNDKAF